MCAKKTKKEIFNVVLNTCIFFIKTLQDTTLNSPLSNLTFLDHDFRFFNKVKIVLNKSVSGVTADLQKACAASARYDFSPLFP